MSRIAYLASADTLPGPNRRPDAFEYDRMRAALDGPFASAGLELVGVQWDGEVDWSGFDAALIGTTWDYWEHLERFIEVLASIEAAVPVFNAVDTVRRNSDKRYLRDLPTPPSCYVDTLDGQVLEACFARFGTDRVVVKKQVGAGAAGQQLIDRGGPWRPMAGGVIVQPFIEAIQTEGEISVIVVDGAISHAVRKCPAAGDYRIQSMYGGTNAPCALTRAQAAFALSMMPEGPLYGRVDLVPWGSGLALMELELIEPYLYPDQGPELGARLAEAVRSRL